jgi:large subunit ribosomal protein L15
MNLSDAKGLGRKRRPRKRLGRGRASGSGKTCGRGHKGAGARAGRMHTRTHAGGQVPFFRRFPKRGFTNPFGTRYAVVNVGQLDRAFEAGATVDALALKRVGLVKRAPQGVKVLGQGTLGKALTVRASAFSATAREKIAAAGGTAEAVA